MASYFKCDANGCGQEIGEMGGALVFSPPMDGSCIKLHVCPSCYSRMLQTMFYPYANWIDRPGSREGAGE